MAFQDQNLTCRDCGKPFVWTIGEQEFYAQKGFSNAPVRCPECRRTKRQNFRQNRQMYPITCAKCGKQDQVPFEPKGDRPVLCKDCFIADRQTGSSEVKPEVSGEIKVEEPAKSKKTE